MKLSAMQAFKAAAQPAVFFPYRTMKTNGLKPAA